MAGREALRNNDTATAEQAFKEAIAANPRMPQARIGLADVALRRGSREQAKSFLDEALAIAPKDDSVHHALALFHSAGQDYPAAHAAMRLDLVAGHTLLYTWPGSDPTARPIALLAHQDVVAIAPGTEAKWQASPFSGEVNGSPGSANANSAACSPVSAGTSAAATATRFFSSWR